VKDSTFDYYYFNVEEDFDYEIVLTPISGDPDLAFSFDITNKFPTKERYNFISEMDFATDSIVLPS
jgi:hypothetical protein